MKNKLLSIIVPVYKVEDYLIKCVDSLIKGCGKYLKEVEIVLVDDGSPDNCPILCDELSQKYDVVKTIHKPNGGVSSARNIGIENAVGEYITFCDSDDYVTSDFEKLFDYIKSNQNVDVFSVGLIKNNKILSKFSNQIFNPQNYNDIYEIIKRDVTISCCAKIVKRDLITQHNLYIPSGIKSEDFAWSISLLMRTHSYMLLDLAYYVYVDRETSVTHSTTLLGIESQILNYQRIKKLIQDTHFTYRQKKSLLRYLMQGYIYTIYTSKFLNYNQKKEALQLFKQNRDLLYVPHSIKLALYYFYLKIFIL